MELSHLEAFAVLTRGGGKLNINFLSGVIRGGVQHRDHVCGESIDAGSFVPGSLDAHVSFFDFSTIIACPNFDVKSIDDVFEIADSLASPEFLLYSPL